MKLKELETEKEELFKKLSNPEFLSNKKNFEEASRKLKKIEEEIKYLRKQMEDQTELIKNFKKDPVRVMVFKNLFIQDEHIKSFN